MSTFPAGDYPRDIELDDRTLLIIHGLAGAQNKTAAEIVAEAVRVYMLKTIQGQLAREDSNDA